MTANDGTVPDGWESRDGAIVTADGRCWVWQSDVPGHVGDWYAEVNDTPNGFDSGYFPTRADAVTWCETTARAVPAQ